MLKTTGTSSKKDNIPMPNSYSALNAKKDVENVYDETANLFTKTNGSSSTAAAALVKTKVFWPKKDPRSRLAGIFPPNISRPLHGVKLPGLPASVDIDFSSELVMKSVAKTIKLMDAVAKTNDPQCELFLLRACIGILKLYFAMRTCPPRVFELAQRSFNTALRSSLERIVVVPISSLGQAMNGKTYCCVLCYRLGVHLFYVSKPCSTCSKVFVGDIYGDLVLVRKLISSWMGVPLRLSDMLLYSWDGGLDVCVDLTGSSPLTQTGMVDFVPGRAMIDATHLKRGKYETKCAAIGYLVLPFLFSSLGALEVGVITFLKRIREFFMT
uniref:Uncharacterized protein n=1 Tax=Tanacetum cinerariifolium TaxID=118510 RepID=A0A699GS77_TANCI|nr:hypothetical protein [Tanacetum cinerariifolium]